MDVHQLIIVFSSMKGRQPAFERKIFQVCSSRYLQIHLAIDSRNGFIGPVQLRKRDIQIADQVGSMAFEDTVWFSE